MTAYKEAEFYLDTQEYMSPDYFVALDEAYRSIRDVKHLTPFAQSEIDEATRQNNNYAAETMRAFNKILCSDRITIERAFGQLVRRWPALWLELPFENLDDISLMIRVAVKLHNLCVDEFLCEKFGFASPDGDNGSGYPTPIMPTSVGQLLSAHNQQTEPELPTETAEVPELSQEMLMHARDGVAVGHNLRVDMSEDQRIEAAIAVDVDPSIPPIDFSENDDPTLNAGAAVANWRYEDAIAPAEIRRTVRATIGLTNQQQTWVNDLRARGDVSGARRLEICLELQERGMVFYGPGRESTT
jgi:hypothetical protein